MLCSKFARVAAAAPRSGVRALSSTAIKQTNAPGIGDINPQSKSVESFNQKQKAFRERLVDAQKERDARALSQQNATSAVQDTGTAANDGAGLTAENKTPEPSQKSGPLTNLIYGTKEGREMEAQLEASFSQVLARGKYVHSIVFHEVKPDKVDEYVKLVGQWYPKMANLPENKVHLVGSWRTEVGDCDTFGKFDVHAGLIVLVLTNRSTYLGVPKVRGIPRFPPFDIPSPRIRRVRAQADDLDQFQED